MPVPGAPDNVIQVGVARLPANSPFYAFNFQPGIPEKPIRIATSIFPTYGVMFRNHFGTPDETAMLFRAGSNWSHWDTDVFNVVLYAKGAPLSPGTGYGYGPGCIGASNAIYHNRVKLVAHDKKEIFGRADAPVRDYGFGKNADYAKQEQNPFSNFDFTAMFLDWAIEQGVRGFDLSFLALIATKLARIINLRSSGAEPAVIDEAITDTLADMGNYCFLWAGRIQRSQRLGA